MTLLLAGGWVAAGTPKGGFGRVVVRRCRGRIKLFDAGQRQVELGEQDPLFGVDRTGLAMRSATESDAVILDAAQSLERMRRAEC